MGKKLLLSGGIFIILIAGAAIYVGMTAPPIPPDADEVIDQVLATEVPELVTGRAGFAQSGESEIWYEMREPNGPPQGTILLMMGIAADGLGWPPAFLDALVAAGYQVIRYDQRGTGMSDWVEDWDAENPYTLHDMAGDAVAILDALEIDQAHLVGVSMGGMTAQQMAVDYPERVLSLTSIMSSCDIVDPDLPPIAMGVVYDFTRAYLRYGLPGTERSKIKVLLASRQALMGDTPYELDTKGIAEYALNNMRERRGDNPQASAQHNAAVLASGSRYERLQALDMPIMIIHGRSDPFIPFAHGQKCAAVLPTAEVEWVDGMGHDIPDAYMDVIVESILANVERVSRK